MIKNFIKYKWLLSKLISRDLKVKYKRSYLGYIWSILNPLLMMTVLCIVFSYIFRFNIENFPIYLICGQVMFTFFSESTAMTMQSIIQSVGLINKVRIPKIIIPISRTLSCFVNLLFSLIAVVIMLIITKTPIHISILLFPIPLIYLFFISLGIGLILCVFATYFRDTVYLYSIVIQILMYFTPIFYPIDAVPSKVQFIIKFNPMYHIVTYFRDIVLYGNFPSLRDNAVCMAFAVLSMTFGILIFNKNEKNFLLHL